MSSILNTHLNLGWNWRFISLNNRYRAKISVYDNNEQAVFVLLGEAGRELSGKHAAEVVDSYFEVNCHHTIYNPKLFNLTFFNLEC